MLREGVASDFSIDASPQLTVRTVFEPISKCVLIVRATCFGIPLHTEIQCFQRPLDIRLCGYDNIPAKL